MEKSNEFFLYDHENREFSHVTNVKRKDKLDRLANSESVEELEKSLSLEGHDGLLILDTERNKWVLCFASHLGIVGQRTARRQADSIARSGYNKGKYRIRANYPLEELSEANLGDLWKTVQQKYVKSTLTGLELDESGIPSQIAERAKILEGSGYSDALTQAEMEKKEAEMRKKAMAKSGDAPPKIKAPAKKKPSKKPPKKEKEVKKDQKFNIDFVEEEAKSQSVTGDKLENGPHFFEITKIKEYVENNNTVFSMKGVLHLEDNEFDDSTIVFRKDHLPEDVWDAKVIYLREKEIVQVDLVKRGEAYYATSMKV